MRNFPRAAIRAAHPLFSAFVLIIAAASARSSEGTRAHFLSHGPGTVSLAKGETGVADGNDLHAAFYNPALLSGRTEAGIGIIHYPLVEGSRYNSLALNIPLHTSAAIGFSIINLASGDIELRDTLTDTPRIARTGQWAYAVSAAKRFEGRVPADIGLTVKYVYLDLHDRSSGGWGADIGAAKTLKGPVIGGTRTSINTGASIQNVIQPEFRLASENEHYPPLYRAGCSISMPIFYRLSTFDAVTVALDGVVSENDLDLHAGAEYALMQRFFFRAGYFPGHITAGAGIRWSNLQIDYASNISDFESLHRFGVSCYWSSSKTKGTEKKPKHTLLTEARQTLREENELKARREREAGILFRKAKSLYSRKFYITSADRFLEIMQKYPEYGSAQVYYGKITDRMKRDAENTVEFAQAGYARGLISYLDHDYSAALKEWEKTLQADPQNGELAQYSGSVRAYLQNAERIAFEKKLTADVTSFIQEGIRLFGDKQWISCIKNMEKAKAICIATPFPSSIDYYRQAQEYLKRSVGELSLTVRSHKAKPEIRETIPAVEIDEAGAEQKYREGLVLFAQGKLSDAERMWEIALRFNPSHEKARKALGRIRTESKQRQ